MAGVKCPLCGALWLERARLERTVGELAASSDRVVVCDVVPPGIAEAALDMHPSRPPSPEQPVAGGSLRGGSLFGHSPPVPIPGPAPAHPLNRLHRPRSFGPSGPLRASGSPLHAIAVSRAAHAREAQVRNETTEED